MALGNLKPAHGSGNQFGNLQSTKRTARKPAKASRKPKAAKRRSARKKRT